MGYLAGSKAHNTIHTSSKHRLPLERNNAKDSAVDSVKINVFKAPNKKK